MEKTVLSVKELSQRWDMPESTIYNLNRSGKLPHLSVNTGKFPIRAIEDMEAEAQFNPRELRTPRERRLEREVKSLEDIIDKKDVEIKRLKNYLVQIQRFSTQLIYSDFKEMEAL